MTKPRDEWNWLGESKLISLTFRCGVTDEIVTVSDDINIMRAAPDDRPVLTVWTCPACGSSHDIEV